MVDEVSRHYCSRFSAGRLHRKGGILQWRENFVSKTLSASPRPAPKIILKDVCKLRQQQQQQQQDTLRSTGKPVAEQNRGTQRSAGKPVAEEKNPFKVFPQDTVIEDRERMSKIQELVGKLRTEYQTESIVADLVKKGNSTGSAKNQNVHFKNW